MVFLCEHEAEANGFQFFDAFFRRLIDIDAEGFKAVRRAALGRRRAVSVFGNFYASGGDDGSRRRGDIDTVCMIAAGADKISMCSAALRDPELITLASRAFGSQAVIVAIDAKRVGDGDKWEAYVAGGRIPTGVDAIAWAEEAARRGAGEILLTSMDRDGTQDGFDIPLTRTVARAVPIPVIASGGVGKLEHFAEGIIDGEADAVLAASVFHFGTFSIRQVKEYMAREGIPVRLDF